MLKLEEVKKFVEEDLPIMGLSGITLEVTEDGEDFLVTYKEEDEELLKISFGKTFEDWKDFLLSNHSLFRDWYFRGK